MKGKVIIVGPAHPYRGGIASGNNRLALEFQEKGWATKIYTFTLQYPRFLFPGKTQYSESLPPKVEIERYLNSINPINWYILGRKIKKEKPDILVLRFWIPIMGACFGRVARVSKKNGYTKVLAILDNVIPHEKRRGDNFLTKYFINSCDGFIVMSESVRKDLEKFNKTKPWLYNPHPIFDNFGTIIDRKVALKKIGCNNFNARYILFFGFIRKYKGLDILLEAFNDIWFLRNNIFLIIAGEYYQDEEEYKSLINQHPLKNNIISKNKFIPDYEIENYFCSADIVVQPYRSATQSGVSQIAYHFEKPMLVTNVGGLPELVPNNKVGYVVEVNANKIKEALKKFFQNKEYNKFTFNIRREKEKFGWDKMVQSILYLKKKITKK